MRLSCVRCKIACHAASARSLFSECGCFHIFTPNRCSACAPWLLGFTCLICSASAQILPSIFGWEDLFKSRPKLGAYFAAMQTDEAGARVRARARMYINA